MTSFVPSLSLLLIVLNGAETDKENRNNLCIKDSLDNIQLPA